MKAKTLKKENPYLGSNFDDFLEEQGILPEAAALALKRIVSLQIQELIEAQQMTKAELAQRMHTSRASVDRLLDPENASLTVASLGKAAAALGRKLEVRFVPV